jgi:hypothetical protein
MFVVMFITTLNRELRKHFTSVNFVLLYVVCRNNICCCIRTKYRRRPYIRLSFGLHVPCLVVNNIYLVKKVVWQSNNVTSSTMDSINTRFNTYCYKLSLFTKVHSSVILAIETRNGF